MMKPSRSSKATAGAASRRDVREIAVAELMGKPPIAVERNHQLSAALRALSSFRVRHLVVIDDGGRCVGVLTDRALAAYWAAHPGSFDAAQVTAAYAGDVVCVSPETTLTEAARAMRRAGLDAVVVVGEAGEPVGIVTATDLIAAVAAS